MIITISMIISITVLVTVRLRVSTIIISIAITSCYYSIMLLCCIDNYCNKLLPTFLLSLHFILSNLKAN